MEAGNRTTKFLFFLLMTLPNLVWAILDRSVWPSDACLYGESALRLSYSLEHGVMTWLRAMLSTDVIHPPILIWVGQFFVPVGRLIGNIDAGLLVLPFIVQFLALVLLYEALGDLFGAPKYGLLGCLVLSSTPIFVGVGKQFVIQNIQLLVVVWFVCVVIRARYWDSASILFHLTAATALAMLTMLSTLSFCAILGLFALYQVVRKGRVVDVFNRSHLPLALRSLLLVLPALVWFWFNGTTAMAYAAQSYRTRWVARVEDVFFAKLAQWVDFVREGLCLSDATFLVVVGLCILSLASYWRTEERKSRQAGIAAVMSLQLLFALGIHASASQQLYRYALPFAVPLTVVIVWCTFQLDNRWVTRAVAATFLVQGVLVHAGDFGLISIDRKYWSPDLTVDEPRAFELMDGIIEETSDTGRLVLVELRACGVDGAHVTYRAWKRPEFAERAIAGEAAQVETADVFLTSDGIDGDVNAAWNALLVRRPGYYVMPNAEIRRQFARRLMNSTGTSELAETRSLELADRVVKSGLFERVLAPDYSELEIYRYLQPGP